MNALADLVYRFRKFDLSYQRDILTFGGSSIILVVVALFMYWLVEPFQLFLALIIMFIPLTLTTSLIYHISFDLGKREGRFAERKILHKRVATFVRHQDLKNFNVEMKKSIPNRVIKIPRIVSTPTYTSTKNFKKAT